MLSPTEPSSLKKEELPIFVPINTRLAPPEIEFWLNDSESSILFVDKNFSNIAKELIETGKVPSIKKCIYISDGEVPDNMENYEDLVKSSDPIDDALRGYDDIAGIFYTGGTTGRSKGVMLTHTNLMANSFNTITALNIQKDPHWLHAAPMFHIADVTGAIAITHIAGLTSINVPAKRMIKINNKSIPAVPSPKPVIISDSPSGTLS